MSLFIHAHGCMLPTKFNLLNNTLYYVEILK